MRKRKKKFKGFLVLVFLIIIGALFYYIDKNDGEYSNKELSEKIVKLGYKEDTKNKLIELKIGEDILKLNKYYKVIEDALDKDKFNSNCLDSYISLNNIDDVYNLCNFNYNNDEITKLINNLNKDTIIKIKGYMPNLSKYSEYKNFVIDNYDRYEKMKETDIKKKISLVNVNLDYSFYENIKDAKVNDSPILVNKYYKLNSDFPKYQLLDLKLECASRVMKLEKNTKEAFEKLCDDALKVGVTIKGSSGYRSYEAQRLIYNNYINTDNIRNVDTYSARAGHSEHQTGFAIDVYNGTVPYNKFGSTDDYIWAKDNIHKYGFIIRYKKETEYITGYISEPWHFRYVGVEIATYIYKNDITLEEYLLNNKEKI